MSEGRMLENTAHGRDLKLVARHVTELVPYAQNARIHNEAQVAQLAASIKAFGFTNPVLIDEQNTIIAGEGRVSAAQRLKLETVPCIVLAGLTEAQKALYVIADNKLAMNSSWDTQMLADELDRLSAFDLDLCLTGFSEVEAIALLEQVQSELAEAAQSDTAGPDAPDWSGMPEFSDTTNKPFRSIVVHMSDQASVDAFATAIAQTVTEKTKYVWYPLHVKRVAKGLVYE